ncbi:MAG: hypothetical protein ABMA25_04750, partial [Ilumatobacteraceae bacterium]
MRRQFGMLLVTASVAAAVAVALPLQFAAAAAGTGAPAVAPAPEVSPQAAPTLPDVQAVVPSRLLDTRDGSSRVGAGEAVLLPVLDRGGVPATGVGSVLLNVTATKGSATSVVTVWPAGGD